MKNLKNKINKSVLLMIFPLLLIGSSFDLSSAVKVETGYYVINLFPAFYTKANNVSFNFPNSGTKKVGPGQKVLAAQFIIWNKSQKEIKVRRNDFLVNGQSINHYIVHEKKVQPLVVRVPAGKALGIINYYIVNDNVKSLKDMKVIYKGVTKQYKKQSLIIPVIQKKK